MISVVLLAYDEEKSLPKIIPALSETLRPLGEYQVIVVDDGSRDRTAEVARELALSHPVVLVQHGVNKGVARAFDTGLRRAVRDAAAGDLVFTMEGDMTNDPAVLPEMIRRLAEAEIVCASRYREGGAYVGFPIKRRILSVGANALARLFFRVQGVTDFTFFYRGYRAASLRRAIEVFGERFIECRGFAANAEILVKVAQAGARRIAEVPTVYRYDLKPGPSKMAIGKNLVEYLRLFAIALRR